jgi:alpha-glucosidase
MLLNTWDETKLVDGYPGQDVIIARRKGNTWYMGGVSADQRREKRKSIKLDFLPEGVKYKLTLLADGIHDKAFSVNYLAVDKHSSVDVRLLRRGGFAALLSVVQ